MQRETGTILLLTRRRIDVAALARSCVPPWRPWSRGALARAERTADGRVHLVVVRARRRGVLVTVVGVRAGHSETLAPIAARIRRALPAGTGRALRGTSAFEDALAAWLDQTAASTAVRRAIDRLGASCPAARRLRTCPVPARIAAADPATLARAVGSALVARRLQALAREFADAAAPSVPTRSWSRPAKAALVAARSSNTAAALAGG